MKNKIILSIIIFSMVLFNGCNNTQDQLPDSNSNKTSINVDNSILIKEKDNGIYELFSLSKDKMHSLKSIENLMDFKYDVLSQVKVQMISLEKGNNLIKNKLVVESKDGESSIENLYSIADFKLSPQGKYLAYRGFKEDNIESVESLSFYNVEEKESVPINSKILISGDMYDFKDKDTLIYYGVNPTNGIQGIYEYNIENKSESMVYEVKNQYITYLSYIKDDLCLVLQEDFNELKLSLINLKTKKSTMIASNIEEIIDSHIIEDRVYFIGKSNKEDLSVYKYEKGNLKRLTYGFPNVVYENSYLSSDEEGNLYFVGYEDNEEMRDVYSIKEDDSVNLISNDSGKYLIYKNASYLR